MSDGNSLRGSSNFTINGGIFSIVGGNQHNNHGPSTVRDLAHLTDPLAQFHELKMANIRLKRRIADTTVKRDDAEGWRKGWGRLDARRVIYIATLENQREEKEFMYVKYEGSDAVQAYQQDFQTFSTVKDVNWVELFGYIAYNALPGLLFYDALVPVSHIFERNSFSCILHVYLAHSAITQGVDAQTLFRELWVNPRNGTFHRGLYIADSSSVKYRVWPWSALAPANSNCPSLDLRTYNSTSIIFRYLIGVLPVHDIIYGIRWSHKAVPEWPNSQDTKFILSFLPGTVYHRTSCEIVARYPGERGEWYYNPWEERFRVPDAMQENTLVMDDGTVIFMLTLSDIASLESFVLCYGLQPKKLWDSFTDSWLSQSHGILSQLGKEGGDWSEYSILNDFRLFFERKLDREGSHIRTDIPTSTRIYLFIQPVPRPSGDDNEWDGWLAGKRYYWSFDPAGKEEISKDERWRLGLPSFETTIKLWLAWWDRDAYDAIQMVNRHLGFDPVSLEMARSHRHMILEVVGNTRFEEV